MAKNPEYKELTWMSTPPRWRKQYKGKLYYFPLLEEEIAGDDKQRMRRSYPRVLKAWNKKKEELAVKPEDSDGRMWKALAMKLLGAQDVAREYQSEEFEAHFSTLLAGAQKSQEEKRPFPGTEKTVVVPGDIETTIQRFLDEKLRLVERKKLKIRTVTNLNIALNHFKAFAGNLATAEIDANTISGFYEYLENKIKAKKLQEASCKTMWRNTRHFIRWAKESDLIEKLPSNFDSRAKTFSDSAKKIEVFTLEEIKILLDNAKPRLKCWLLLIANMGCNPADLSELMHTEVDWKSGIVTRRRVKTGAHESVPTVSYVLWPITLQLLNQFRSKDPTYVLLTESGKRLQSERLSCKTDRVNNVYRNFARRVGINKSIGVFRNTISSMIANNREFGRDTARLFLAHAPNTIDDKHYLVADQANLDAAIAWVGKELGVVPSSDGSAVATMRIAAATAPQSPR